MSKEEVGVYKCDDCGKSDKKEYFCAYTNKKCIPGKTYKEICCEDCVQRCVWCEKTIDKSLFIKCKNDCRWSRDERDVDCLCTDMEITYIGCIPCAKSQKHIMTCDICSEYMCRIKDENKCHSCGKSICLRCTIWQCRCPDAERICKECGVSKSTVPKKHDADTKRLCLCCRGCYKCCHCFKCDACKTCMMCARKTDPTYEFYYITGGLCREEITGRRPRKVLCEECVDCDSDEE